MISNKTAATIFLIVLNMQRAASTSPGGTKRPSPSDNSVRAKRQKRTSGARGAVLALRDTTSVVRNVEAIGENIEAMSISLEQPASLVKSQFKELIEQGEYGKIFGLGEKMNDEEFLKQLCPVIETLDQYNGIVSYLRSRNLVASFYIHGNIGVVKEAIIESKVYDGERYVKDGDLETALPLALNEDSHDRVIELLDVRKEATAEKDKQPKLERRASSFAYFVGSFLKNLASRKDEMALGRFLILRCEELRNKYRDIFNTLCRWLVYQLRGELRLPKAERLLVDLIGQPSLLTPVAFARAFLYHDNGMHRSTFIKYGWREAIQEGLKTKYHDGGENLWLVMQEEKPEQFPGVFPVTEEARAAACMHIPTKQQKEKEWIKKYFAILFDQLNDLDFLPTVLWSIISEYAVLFIATMDLTISTE